VMVVGGVRREIVRVAVREHVTMVVLGVSPRTDEGGMPIRRDTAEWVASHVPCPVWVVCSRPSPTCGRPGRTGELQDRDNALPAYPGYARDLSAWL
jgi:hypothetical protein